MDPNQQPNQVPQQPGPLPQPAPQPTYPQPLAQPPQPVPSTTEFTAAPAPSAYAAAPSQSYDPNYLDSIAPPPPRAKFLSGIFGKLFFALIGVFVLIVSLIIAFSGQNKTADLQQITVRVTNFGLIAKTQQPNLKSNNLSATNSQFEIWLTNAQSGAESLLKAAGVKKSEYDKTMTTNEKTLSTNLTKKFDDARLNISLDRIYASTMASETAKLISMYNTMSKKSQSKQIRDYAKTTATNLQSIQKSFDSYTDDGN
jgi:hypothetical protein